MNNSSKDHLLHRAIRTALGTLGVGAGAGLLALGWGTRELTQFELKEETLALLPPGTLRSYATPGVSPSFKILHISDLHMLANQHAKQQWVKSLDALAPDLVINTGDNLGEAQAVPAVLDALSGLLNRPGLFVFGTNDYFAPRPVNPLGYLRKKKRPVSRVSLPYGGMRDAFIQRGWHDMTHQRLDFKCGPVKLAVAGVDDPHHNLDDYQSIAGPPNPDADLSIALTHSPEPRVLERFAADGYTISFSGHTHGGQICLPALGSQGWKFGTPLVTNCGIDPERAYGLHKFGRMWMQVSNGLGTSKFAPVRLFCRPTATLIKITETSKL